MLLLKQKKWKIVSVGIISVIILSCFIFIAIIRENKRISRIETTIKMKFPSSVDWGYSQINCWMECSIFCSFKIDKMDVPLFLEQFNAKKQVVWSKTNRYVIGRLQPGVHWFKPDQISNFQAMEINYPQENTILGILYDDSVQKGKVQFYLIWFETAGGNVTVVEENEEQC